MSTFEVSVQPEAPGTHVIRIHGEMFRVEFADALEVRDERTAVYADDVTPRFRITGMSEWICFSRPSASPVPGVVFETGA